MRFITKSPLFAALFAVSAYSSLQIIPGATWTATNTGKHVQAHGGSITNVNGLYYLVGENKQNGSAFQAVSCYSSPDLVQWTFVNNLLTLQGSGDLGPNRVIERPKVIWNAASNQWIMWWMHVDSSNYGEAKVGVATSSSICGSYNYIKSFQPLGFQSRDMGLFKDTDGTGYLLTEDGRVSSRSRQNGLRIDKLSSDYLSVASATYNFGTSADYEAPAMVKVNGVYFMFGSHLTGWDTNDNIYATATNLAGPWSSWKTFAPSGTRTYDSQMTFILQVGNSFMYMGDRWFSSNLMRSSYIWLPMTISGTTASMNTNYVNWVIDLNTGTGSGGPSENSYEGESATLSNGAKSVSCSGCSGTQAAGYIGGSSNGIIKFNSVSSNASTKTTIRIKHENGDTSQRFADITVNGQTQRIAFLPTTDGNTPGSSSLHVNLNSGSSDTVQIVGVSGGWVSDIDRIMVPVS